MAINDFNFNRCVSPTMLSRHKSLHKEKGVVLIVTLVFLVALTGVAGALMQSTTSDMKMTSASNEKTIATQAAISAVDEILDNQLNQVAINNFGGSLKTLTGYGTADLLPADSKTGAEATISVINNDTFTEVDCGASEVGAGMSSGLIMCNVFEIQTTRAYGRNNTSTVVVNTGMKQQLIGAQ